MRTLDRYIFKEISTSWAAVTVVLLVIMVANVLARILSKVTDGSIPADALFVLVGIKVINLLVTLIPLGLYLGVLLAFGRLYRDSEMSAIAACGTGLGVLYRPALINGLIGMLLITLLTFGASPWAARYEQQLTEKIATQSVGMKSSIECLSTAIWRTVRLKLNLPSTQSISAMKRQTKSSSFLSMV